MLSLNRHNPFTRLLCLLLALHFLNLSIDPRDPNPDSVPEDLSLNDIESVTEFFAEVVLNRVDAFQEHDERDNDDGGSLDICKYYCPNNSLIINTSSFIFSKQKFQIRNSEFVESPSANIIIPPPKVK